MTDNHTDEVDLELERLQRERDEARLVHAEDLCKASSELRELVQKHTQVQDMLIEARDAALRERDEYRLSNEALGRTADAYTDRIKALRVQLTQAREALSGLMPFVEEDFPEGDNLPVTWAYGQAVLKARAALSPKKETT